MSDEFDHLSPRERIMLQMVLNRYRIDQENGTPWVELWPRPPCNGHWLSPILLAASPNGQQSQALFSTDSKAEVVAEVNGCQVIDNEDGHLDKKPRLEQRNGATVREDDPLPPDICNCATCRETILSLLQCQKQRMTGGEVLQWLNDHGKRYSKSQVDKDLVGLKNEGKLSNHNDGYGKGYGLSEWSH